jgi:TPR repeat protein
MSHDVFISHSAKNKVIGDAVCAMLESDGVRCWIAPRDVTPSREWGECIVEAIEQSRIMILVFTADANTSPQIRREVERAANNGVAILPLRLEDVTPAKALDYFIGNLHWLDALTPPLEAHLRNLSGTVKMLLARMPSRDAPGLQPPIQPDAPLISKLPEPAASEKVGVQSGPANQGRSPAASAQPPMIEPVASETPPKQPFAVPAVPTKASREEPAPAVKTKVAPAPPALKPPPTLSSGVGAAPSKTTGVRNAWRAVILGAVAALLVSLWAVHFARKHATPQVRNEATPAVHSDNANSVAGHSDTVASVPPEVGNGQALAGPSDKLTPSNPQTPSQVSKQDKTTKPSNCPPIFISGRPNFQQALPCYQDAAAAGNTVGMDGMGEIFEHMGEVDEGEAPRDFKQALFLFERAAAAGDSGGMDGLGEMYLNGFGVTRDYQQARQWFEKATAAGDSDAMVGLGNLYVNGWGVPRNYQQARQLYEKAAAAGNSSGTLGLGDLYQEGWGVPQDLPQARKWYERAVAAGDIDAMNDLGMTYEEGTPDYPQARKWLEKAAAAGDVSSMNNLGDLYENGWGVTQDYKQARQWYEKSVAAGNSSDMYELGLLYENGEGVPQDYQQARQLFEKDAAAGDARGMQELGTLYERGEGVPQDYKQARQWYEKAVAAGDAQAQDHLKTLPQ